MVRCLSCDKLVLAGRMRRNNARKKKKFVKVICKLKHQLFSIIEERCGKGR